MRDHTKLRAFELADKLVLKIYKATKKIFQEETYGLTSQMRRAAVSVPSNVVEGCQEKVRAKLHYQLYLKQHDRANNDELRIIETEKVLGALIRALRKT